MGEKRAALLQALGFLEFLAAVHILAFHCIYIPGKHAHMGQQPFLSWGGTWDPFFFVLNGFKLSYVQLIKEDPDKVERVMPFFRRRILRVYPIILLDTLLLIPFRYLHWYPARWHALPFNLLLVQTWTLPYWDARDWNGAKWFFSCCAWYWLMWPLLFRRIHALSKRHLWLMFFAMVLLTYPRILLTRLYPFKDTMNTFFVYSPLANLHVFICGMCIAELFMAGVTLPWNRFLTINWKGQEYPFSASIAFALLLFYWAVTPPWDRQPAKVGQLIPLQASLMWGLAEGQDPLAKLFALPLLSGLGKYSLPVLVMQNFSITFLFKPFILQMQYWSLITFTVAILPVHLGIAILLNTLADKLLQPPVDKTLKFLFR